jgi:hypothetical protein
MTKIPTAGVPSGATAPKWWLVYYEPIGVHDLPGTAKSKFMVIQAVNKAVASATVTKQGGAVSKVLGPFASRAAAIKSQSGNPLTNVQASGGANVPGSVLNPASWLGGLGGMIGSGIEAGIVSLLTDLWDVVQAPLEIALGAVIALFVLAIYFKDDIGGVIGTVAMAAA